MPSSTAMVLNSRATAARLDDRLGDESAERLQVDVARARTAVKQFAIAMIGLSKSASAMPVARQSARAAACVFPWVVRCDR